MSYLISKNQEKTLNPDKPMFPISIVADILKVSIRTLRIYEETQLLIPSRSDKNRRLYSINDIEKGKLIQYLSKELNTNLMGIKVVFCLLAHSGVEPEKYIDYVREKTKELSISINTNNLKDES